MTRLQEIEARLAAIQSELETRGDQLTAEQLTNLDNEVTALKEERNALRDAAEQRRSILTAIAEGREPAAQVTRSFPGPSTIAAVQEETRASAELDPYDTLEYRRAFMEYACRNVPISAELRADQTTTVGAGDVSAVVPTTILQELIEKMESYGEIYAKVRKLNIQGGVEVPILTLKPTAAWVGEGSGDDQKIKADDKVNFLYYGIECKIAQSLLASVVTLEMFQREFVKLSVEAIVSAMEIAIFNGSGTGQPLGITKDTRIPAANILTISSTDFGSWEGWKKKIFAKMKKSYRTGEFIMAQGTFDGYIDGMVDGIGQPIGRVNYGMDGSENYRFGGKNVLTVEDDVITSYEDASAGDVVAVFIKLDNYAINSNMQMTLTKWRDEDKNQVKNKALMYCDGKLLDTNGVLIIKKGA